MSAIFGIFHRDGRPVNPAELARMQAALAHRGPDGAGAWHDGPAGLGQLMLHTTPESLNEHLPLLSRDGRLVLTADARLDNRDELIAALDLRDRPAAQLADSELILAAYERWGERCVERLLGDFAFAVWDRREQQLFCARDHMGVKPFYYYCSDRLVAFASEIKGLLALPQVPRRLNEVRVADYLVPLLEDPELTFYRDILRLPAAHRLSVSIGHTQVRRYWDLDPDRELRYRSDAAYAEAFRAHFTEAVHCRLRSAFPVGSTLSGGLDSSSIACTARDLLAQAGKPPLHTFSAIFPGLPPSDLRMIDERPYMAAVVAMGGVEPHYIHADQLSPLGAHKHMLQYAGGPVFAPNLYLHWAMYGSARSQGARIFFDGIDGDTTVSHGIDYLAELVRAGNWFRLVREARALASRPPAQIGTWAIMRDYAIRPALPVYAARTWDRLNRKGAAQPDQGIVNPVFARRVGLSERLRMLQAPREAPIRTEREAHWRGLRSAKLPFALEEADWAAAAFGIEPRYPFCDRRLVEFCLALPPQQKLSDGMTRMVFSRAMKGVLPEKVRLRTTKGNLSPNFLRRLLERDQQAIEDALFYQPQVVEPYVDLEAVRVAYARYKARPEYATRDALAVHRVVILSAALRHFDLTETEPMMIKSHVHRLVALTTDQSLS